MGSPLLRFPKNNLHTLEESASKKLNACQIGCEREYVHYKPLANKELGPARADRALFRGRFNDLVQKRERTFHVRNGKYGRHWSIYQDYRQMLDAEKLDGVMAMTRAHQRVLPCNVSFWRNDQ